jgi:hypothetical protein
MVGEGDGTFRPLIANDSGVELRTHEKNVSDGLKTEETCRFENRVRVGGRKTPSEGCSDGGAGLDWKDRQVGLIWSLVR